MRTKRRGMDILLNFSIPSLTPNATMPAEQARKIVLKMSGTHPVGRNSPRFYVKDLKKYSIDHPPTML